MGVVEDIIKDIDIEQLIIKLDTKNQSYDYTKLIEVLSDEYPIIYGDDDLSPTNILEDKLEGILEDLGIIPYFNSTPISVEDRKRINECKTRLREISD